jgi:AraC family transcriptional regulator
MIRHSGDHIVADPNTITLYNRGQEYVREPISPDGDRCDWFGVSPALFREAIRAWDPRAADHDDRPLHPTHAHISAATYLAQRRLFIEVACGTPDVLHVEETVVRLLDEVLAAAYSSRSVTRDGSQRSDVIAPTQWVLGRALGESLTLAEVADAVGASMFHLCRTFRAQTGHTLHGYRTQLRVRSALERLEDGERDLTRLALDLGFSSHSHFTAMLRRALGFAPSEVRTMLRHGAQRVARGLATPLDTTKTRPE